MFVYILTFMYRAMKGTKICSAHRIFKSNCKLFMCAKGKHKTKRDTVRLPILPPLCYLWFGNLVAWLEPNM